MDACSVTIQQAFNSTLQTCKVGSNPPPRPWQARSNINGAASKPPSISFNSMITMTDPSTTGNTHPPQPTTFNVAYVYTGDQVKKDHRVRQRAKRGGELFSHTREEEREGCVSCKGQLTVGSVLIFLTQPKVGV
ncbi:hypothetical protein ACLOJK_028263 [Asimina triloba]